MANRWAPPSKNRRCDGGFQRRVETNSSRSPIQPFIPNYSLLQHISHHLPKNRSPPRPLFSTSFSLSPILSARSSLPSLAQQHSRLAPAPARPSPLPPLPPRQPLPASSPIAPSLFYRAAGFIGGRRDSSEVLPDSSAGRSTARRLVPSAAGQPLLFVGIVMDQFWSQFNGEVNYTPTIDLTAMNGTPPDVTVNVEQQDAQSGEAASMRATGGKKKGTASRSKNFAQDEDESLCSAYLNVSKDAAVGVNQTYKSYWTRISDYYNEVSQNPTVRSLSSLQHRWGDIQEDTARFCGFYSKIVRRNESGQSEDDKVKDALQMYAGVVGSPFKLIHCWLILRHSAKWNEWLAKEWDKGTKDKASAQDVTQDSPGASGQEGTGGSNIPTRPIGRDKAKRLCIALLALLLVAQHT